MKAFILKTILFVSVTCISYSSYGQLEISLNDNSGFTADNRIKIRFTVTNLDTTPAYFHWAYEITPEVPSEWQVDVFKDALACFYGITSAQCGLEYVNFIPAGGSYYYYQMEVVTSNAFVDGCITVHLLDQCVEEDHDTLASYNFKFDKDWPVGIESSEVADETVIHPNPTSGMVNISNDEQITVIAIFNTKGKRLSLKSHSPGLAHDLSDLTDGLYFLCLYDQSGQLIKNHKLIKL